MSVLHIIDQNKYGDPYGCGVACLAMLLSMGHGNIEKKYKEIRKLLFPSYPKGKTFRGELDLRTGIKALKKILHDAGISTELTTHSKKDFFEYPASVLLVKYGDTLHWVIAFKFNERMYIADSELKDYWEVENYFTESYEIVRNRMYIGLPDTRVNEVIYE